MSKPTLLDLFCKAGGASRGYMDAGFLVVGVDNQPQPRYIGHAFYCADALEFMREHGHRFDAIAASPQCHAMTSVSNRWRGKGTKADPRRAGQRTHEGDGRSHTGRIGGRRMTLLRLCARWLYWRVRVARQERAPRPLGAFTQAWIGRWCHPVAALRLDALWRGLGGVAAAMGRAFVVIPGVGPLANLGGSLGGLGDASGLVGSGSDARRQGELRIGGGITLADLHGPGLRHSGFEAHRQAEQLRDSLSRLQAQQHDPFRSAFLAQMLENRNRP